MAKFKIRHSRKIPGCNRAEFDVEFLGSELYPGDPFKTYDTHHPVVWTVLKVTGSDPVVVTCETRLGLCWNDQFASSIVDTTAERCPEAFYYIQEEK